MVILIRKHRLVAHTLERAIEREDLAIRDSEPLLSVSLFLSQLLGELGLKPTPLTVRPESTVTVRRLVQELLVTPRFFTSCLRARGHPTP